METDRAFAGPGPPVDEEPPGVPGQDPGGAGIHDDDEGTSSVARPASGAGPLDEAQLAEQRQAAQQRRDEMAARERASDTKPLTVEDALAAHPDQPGLAYLELAARSLDTGPERRRVIEEILTKRNAAGPGLVECLRCGRDSCAGDCGPIAVAPPLRPRRASEMLAEPRPTAVIEGIAWAGCISVLVSESGAGKTFLLLGAGAAAGDGRMWHGRAVTRGSVVYVSFEGDAFGLRLRALADAGYSLEDLYIIRASDSLSPRLGRDGGESYSAGEASVSEALQALSAQLAGEGRPSIVLVIVDTVRASLSGSEDSSEQVSSYLRAVRRIMAPVPGAAFVLAHHAGWQDDRETRRRRERGSSALRGNVDATFYLEVAEDVPEEHRAYLELRALKVRDEERPAPLRLLRRRVEVLGTDSHGQPLTSCIIERDPRSYEDRQAHEAATAQGEEQALDARILGIVRDHAPTSLDAIRVMSAAQRAAVCASVGRLLRGGLVEHPRQRDPYTLTAAGSQVLEESSPVVPSRPRVVPGTGR